MIQNYMNNITKKSSNVTIMRKLRGGGRGDCLYKIYKITWAL
jgi:hypothetical protein